MAKRTDRNIIVGLDIGTSKVAAIVAEHTVDGEIDIIGIGVAPSKGLKKGVVVNLESTVFSIQRAIEEAELMAGCQIQSVFAGISGSHIKSLNSHGIVAIRAEGQGCGSTSHINKRVVTIKFTDLKCDIFGVRLATIVTGITESIAS